LELYRSHKANRIIKKKYIFIYQISL